MVNMKEYKKHELTFEEIWIMNASKAKAFEETAIRELMSFGYSREEVENMRNGKNPDGSEFVEVPW